MRYQDAPLSACLLCCLILSAANVRAQTPVPPELSDPARQIARAEAPKSTSGENTKVTGIRMREAMKPKPQASPEPKVMDKKFMSLMIGLQASTILDLESTFHALKNCPPGYTCREGNPLMVPFVRQGRPASYAVTTGLNALAVWGSYKMKKRGNRFWWVPMAAQIGIHTFAAARNFRTAR
ncbi:MAG: hypothetical protein ACKV2V_23630 [Blastocatellia bacterium]